MITPSLVHYEQLRENSEDDWFWDENGDCGQEQQRFFMSPCNLSEIPR